MQKRRLVLFMACILALSMSAAVFATGVSKVTINALYREPDIEVNVPSAGQMYLNPKSLPMVVDGKVENKQIINIPWSIENQSEVAISVNAKIYATINRKSSMTLSSSSLAASTTRTKRAFIYLDKRVTDPGVDLSTLDWDQSVYDGNVQLLVTEAGRERNNFLTLAGTDENGNALPGSVGAFRLNGDAVTNPREEWNPAVDNIAVHITFTFRPTAAPAA